MQTSLWDKSKKLRQRRHGINGSSKFLNTHMIKKKVASLLLNNCSYICKNKKQKTKKSQWRILKVEQETKIDVKVTTMPHLFFLANYHSCSEVAQQATFTSRLFSNSNVFPSPERQLSRVRALQCSNISEGSAAPPALMTSRCSQTTLQLCVNSRQPISNTHSATLFFKIFFLNDLLSEAAPLEPRIKIKIWQCENIQAF